MRQPFVVAAITIAVLTATVLGADSGWFILGGSANVSCGQFLAALQDGAHIGQSRTVTTDGIQFVDLKYTMLEYASGVLTGLNISHTTPIHQIKVDQAALEVWLTNYCQAHPTNTFLDAIGAFAQQAQRR